MTRKTTKDQTKTRRDEEKECVAFFCALCRWFSSVASSSGRLRSKILFFSSSWGPHEMSSLRFSRLFTKLQKTQRVSSQKCKLKPLTNPRLWRRPLTMIVSSNRYSRSNNDYLRIPAIWAKLLESEICREWYQRSLTLNFTATTGQRKSWYSFFESVFFKQEEERASREQ